MPKKIEFGSSEVIVNTIEVGGTKVENLSLQEVTEEGAVTTVPMTVSNLSLDEENTQLLFSDGKQIKGTPDITHDKVNRLTNINGKLAVGHTLSVDDQTESTRIAGNTTTDFLHVNQIAFNTNGLFLTPKTITSSFSDGTLTVNCNFAQFGRCLATGEFSGTLSTYTFNGMLQESRVHVLLPQATSPFTLSSTISGAVFEKRGDLSVDVGDHVLLEIENINNVILITPKIFS